VMSSSRAPPQASSPSEACPVKSTLRVEDLRRHAVP
jgi:hypothetical protein